MSENHLLLVIDDEEAVREAIEDILDTVGISVLLAENGQQGVDLFAQHQSKIGAVLLDMRMPGLSGADTLQAIRNIDATVNVLISSGFSESQLVQTLADQDSVDFLAKPYDFDTLIRKVQAILDVSL